MSDKLISYLNLLYKLSDILNDNKLDDSIKTYLLECKNICINQLKSEHLIKIFLDEINYNSNTLTKQHENIMSPEQFDNLGSGLLKLIRISDSTTTITNNSSSKNSSSQIKNELNLSVGNIKVQITKK
jgi:hypothetical protein